MENNSREMSGTSRVTSCIPETSVAVGRYLECVYVTLSTFASCLNRTENSRVGGPIPSLATQAKQ